LFPLSITKRKGGKLHPQLKVTDFKGEKGKQMYLKNRYAISLIIGIGVFVAILDNTVVNVAIAAMQATFGTNTSTIQWVTTAYFLSQAAIIPAAGYFSSRFGMRRMYLISLTIFTIGSLLCGISPLFGAGGEYWLIISRIIQGIGGGAIMPLAMAMAFHIFKPEERASASAIFAMPVMIAPALGPTIGGLLVDNVGWGWIFLINLPIGIIALITIGLFISADTFATNNANRGGFDYIGLVLSMVGVSLMVYALALVSQTDTLTITAQNQIGEVHGWDYWLVWVLLGSGAALLAVCAFYEIRLTKDPVVDFNLFRSASFTIANVVTWISRAVIFGSFFLLPLYLQQFRGWSALDTGLIFIAQGVGSMIGLSTGGKLYDTIGPRRLVILGLSLLSLTSFGFIFTGTTSDWVFFTPLLFIRGIGFSWSGFPLQTVALEKISGRDMPKASALYNATATIFSSVGVAVLSTAFIQQIKDNTSRLAGQFPPQQLGAQVGTSSLSQVFILVSIGTVLTILVSLLLPAKSAKQLAQANQAKTEPTRELNMVES
jgi:EmrB/QacA subfamily drug resistance transporter